MPRPTRPVPAVIVVHGGGWEAGDKVTYVTPLFEPLARAGLAWFSLDYRLTPASTHEEQLADLREAIRFIRAGRTRFNIDPARIVLVGESASGQMVTEIATGIRALPASCRSMACTTFLRWSPTPHHDHSSCVSSGARYWTTSRARCSGGIPPSTRHTGRCRRCCWSTERVNGWAQAQAFAQRLPTLVSAMRRSRSTARHTVSRTGRAMWSGRPTSDGSWTGSGRSSQPDDCCGIASFPNRRGWGLGARKTRSRKFEPSESRVPSPEPRAPNASDPEARLSGVRHAQRHSAVQTVARAVRALAVGTAR